eukprot:g528.t1
MHYDGPFIVACNTRRAGRKEVTKSVRAQEIKVSEKKQSDRRFNGRRGGGRKKNAMSAARKAPTSGRGYNFKGKRIERPPGGRSSIEFSSVAQEKMPQESVVCGGGANAIMRLRKHRRSDGENVRATMPSLEKYEGLGAEEESTVGVSAAEEASCYEPVYGGDVHSEKYQVYNPYRCSTSRGEAIRVPPEDSGETIMSSPKKHHCEKSRSSSRSTSSNAFANGNQFNVLTGRSSTRRIAPPGGNSSFTFY